VARDCELETLGFVVSGENGRQCSRGGKDHFRGIGAARRPEVLRWLLSAVSGPKALLPLRVPALAAEWRQRQFRGHNGLNGQANPTPQSNPFTKIDSLASGLTRRNTSLTTPLVSAADRLLATESNTTALPA